MIFAPRSWPSSRAWRSPHESCWPRLRKYMAVKLRIVGCSPAWPNPGGAQSGYLVEDAGRRPLLDCGGVLRGSASGEAMAARRCDRDHALAPRPLGRPRAMGLGGAVRAAERSTRRSSGFRRVDRSFRRDLGARLGQPDMFDGAFGVHEFEPGTPFGRRACRCRRAGAALRPRGLRVSGSANGSVLAYSGTPEAAVSWSSLATPTSSSARRRWRTERRNARGVRGVTLRPTRRRRLGPKRARSGFSPPPTPGGTTPRRAPTSRATRGVEVEV